MELIAVIMAAPDYKVRFADAAALLNYGFSKCQIYTDANTDTLPALPVSKGTSDMLPLCYQAPFRYVVTDGSNLSDIIKELRAPGICSGSRRSRGCGRAGSVSAKWQ